MSIARRLGNLEADNDPTERVVRWLEEAHQYDSLDAYVAVMVEDGLEGMPLTRLPREAMAAIRAGKGPRDQDVQREIDDAVRAILFRVHLAIDLMAVTLAALERELLLHGCLSAHLALATVGGCERGGGIGVDLVRDLMLGRVAELLAIQEAREQAEARHLGGHTTLFPETSRRWAEQLETSQRSAVMAMRMAELDGLPDADSALGLPSDERIGNLLVDYVERARIKALDDLGEGSAMLRRMRSWFLPKMEAAEA